VWVGGGRGGGGAVGGGGCQFEREDVCVILGVAYDAGDCCFVREGGRRRLGRSCRREGGREGREGGICLKTCLLHFYVTKCRSFSF